MTTDHRAIEELLEAPLPKPAPGLYAALARRAAAEGIADVTYAVADTAIGRLVLARTPLGLVRVAFAAPEEVAADLATRISPRVLEAPAALDDERRQLDDYLAGRRRTFDLQLDWRLSQGFRRAALAAIAAIPYGSTASYGDVAQGAGNAAAVRAAGSACRTNPLVVVVPCHRVVRGDGTLGGYAGGMDAKRRLLELEGVLAA